MLRLFTKQSKFRLARVLSTQTNNKETVDFGFKDVHVQEKQGLVDKVFNSVAEKYDVMNDLMSLGVHRLWKYTTVTELGDLNFPNLKIIDVAGGTGDLAYQMYSRNQNLDITVCDINDSMLQSGKQRAQQMGYSNFSYLDIKFVQGNAEELKMFEDCTFDIYTIAFGIRNVTDRSKALKEAYRILKPGGRFLCLEFSKVTLPLLAQMYYLHRFYVIPWIGHFVAGDYDSYKYLSESIEKFPDQEHYLSMVKEAGFKNCYYRNLTFGMVSLHSGIKIQ